MKQYVADRGWMGMLRQKQEGVRQPRPRGSTIEFARGNCRVCAFEPPLHSGEREKKKIKEETDLPSAAALSAARRGKQVAKQFNSWTFL